MQVNTPEFETLERASGDDAQERSEPAGGHRPVTRRTVLTSISASALLAACSDLADLFPGGAPWRRRRRRRNQPGSPSETTAPSETPPSETGTEPGSPSAGPTAPPAPAPSPGAPVEPVLADDDVLHVLRRTTFGPTAELVATVRDMGIDAWLDQQLAPDEIDDSACEQLLERYPALQLEAQQILDLPEEQGGSRQADRDLVEATALRNLCTQRQLHEVMVEFWANHLHIQTPNDDDSGRRTVSDRTVYRAHALGSFADLLRASATDPAMLRYLDNGASCFGNDGDPSSVQENYGRELLELHTVGIEAGYTEEDVKNSAYVMTGWSVNNTREFTFKPGCHYPGSVQVLEFSHPNETREGGLEVGEEYLDYLARHPATATTVCTKLARRFVSDDPPEELVAALAQTYLDNDTEIVPVLRQLFASDEFRASIGQKTKRPLEDVMSSARALGLTARPDPEQDTRTLRDAAAELGQAPMGWGPPNGFPDVAEAWLSSSRLLGGWNFHWDLVDGRYDGWMTPASEALAALDDGSAGTVGELADALTQRLLWQEMRPEDRQAAIEFTGRAEDDPVGEGDELTNLRKRIALAILNSPYHLQR